MLHDRTKVVAENLFFFFKGVLTRIRGIAKNFGVSKIARDGLRTLAIRIPAVLDGLSMDHADFPIREMPDVNPIVRAHLPSSFCPVGAGKFSPRWIIHGRYATIICSRTPPAFSTLAAIVAFSISSP